MLTHPRFGGCGVWGSGVWANCAGSGRAAMLLVIFLGVVPGAPLPMAFQALELKPAVMTSAFPTTTTDIPGLAIYFSVAGPTLKP